MKNKISISLLILGLVWTLFIGTPLLAQKSIADSSISLVMLDISYRGLLPGGDLGERFGFNSQVGVDIGVKFASNFYVGTGFHALFSDSVNMEGVLDPLLASGGFLVTDNGLLSDTRVLQSGFVIPVSIGKIFPIVSGHTPNSGLFVEIGGQFLMHKINIRATEDDVAGLEGEYIKGYDRLTSGLGVRESIGYRYFAKNGMVNIAIGLDFSQHLTRSRRSIDFSTGIQDTSQRLDLLSGIRFSWTFPLYRRAPSQAYFY